ncbi:aldo/keto reductase [Lutispora saccharofermentans]|uniref:Aldo/keto reductase n=1 Tax=Lutispora saccharofermentans TaxID=3024236 RepID=A0ABT1NJH8_9FIRM|nr:aldo/keto reductase [Lutispora saccharofermentans]MCQ1531432.1 aldo/keto reductase [Lutispora saccharofermentans]
MEKVVLGNTGIEVTRLCFGALPLGPLQRNLPVEESSEIIAYALDNGVNFIDTAQAYRTYPHIKGALKKIKFRPVIATKSPAASYEEMEKAVLEALEGMEIDYIDIFHLHAARAQADVFELRKGALQCLLDYKKKGMIKAVGISTHSVKVVEAAAAREDIDVVFPLINKIGRGILEGTVDEMEKAIALCDKNGKGIYLMKVLGGGTMIDDYDSSMEYAMNLGRNYPIAIGMISKEEVTYNIRYFNGERNLEGIISIRNKKIVRVSQNMCVGCGICIGTCHSDAISFDDSTGKAYIDPSKCIQCGYCVAACPQFSIRVV